MHSDAPARVTYDRSADRQMRAKQFADQSPLPTPRVPTGAVEHVVRLRPVVQLRANLSHVTGVAQSAYGLLQIANPFFDLVEIVNVYPACG